MTKAEKISGTIFGIIAVVVLIIFIQNAKNTVDTPLQEQLESTIRVATYNVHYISLRSGDGAWSIPGWDTRKASLQESFAALDADIVAFQEMESYGRGGDKNTNLTKEFLIENNPNYTAGATGDALTFPSTQPIFYKTEKFNLVNQGWFFFSETPDVIYSRAFNGSFPSFASWVELENKETGNVKKVVNIHVDFSSFTNRTRSIELVVNRVQPWLDANEHVLVVGDLNARLGSKVHAYLEMIGMQFADVKGSTYHFNRGLHLFDAIDHIAYSNAFEVIGNPAVIQENYDGMWPTDHYPVVVDLKL